MYICTYIHKEREEDIYFMKLAHLIMIGSKSEIHRAGQQAGNQSRFIG